MNNLEKSHSINKLIMKKIHEVCKRHNVTYFLDSGTLIGAVRHKSFIPWDDDVDVAFTRGEYEKFLSIPKEEWGADFEIVTYERIAPGGFFDFVTRVIYHGQTVPLKCYEKVEHKLDKRYADKIGVDCFVMDSAYDNRLFQKLLLLRIMMVYGQLMGHREHIDYSEYNPVQRVVIWVLSHIGKHRAVDALYRKYEKLTRSVQSDTKHLYYSNYPIHLMGVKLKKVWFRETVPMPIDDEWFDAPIDYDNVLRAQYGDYMQLPKESERVPQHIIMED